MHCIWSNFMCIACCSIIRTINLSEPPLVLISSDNRSSTVLCFALDLYQTKKQIYSKVHYCVSQKGNLLCFALDLYQTFSCKMECYGQNDFLLMKLLWFSYEMLKTTTRYTVLFFMMQQKLNAQFFILKIWKRENNQGMSKLSSSITLAQH